MTKAERSKYYTEKLIEAIPFFAEWIVNQKGTSVKLPLWLEDGNFTLTLARDK